MNAVIFTHPPDYPSAIIAAHQLERLGITVYLAIEASHSEPDWKRVIRTTFNRNANLNGAECVRGIIALLQEISGGKGWVFKVDSDCMVRDLSWLKTKDPAGRDTSPGMIGFTFPDRRGQRGIYGACYAIRAERLPELAKRAEGLVDLTHRPMPEDQTMGKLGDSIGCHRHRFGYGKGMFRFFRKNEDTIESLRQYAVIGVQRDTGTSATFLREHVVKTMAQLYDQMTEGSLGQ